MKHISIYTSLLSFFLITGLFAQENYYNSFIKEINNYSLKIIEKNILDTDSEYGATVTDLGDFNGDSYPDFAVGALQAGYNDGHVFIYFGGPQLDNIADLILYGDNENSNFGVSVSGAGDLNADGFDDIIIGSGISSSNDKKCKIYFGGSNPDTITDIVIYGGTSNSSHFSFRVSGAGDVNSDGFDDVVIGDYGYNNYCGEAYIYFGGNEMDTICDVVLSPNVIAPVYNAAFGGSVAKGGDINNDGFDDVIIGSPWDNGSTGAAYIFFGGEGMDSNAIIIEGRTIEQTYSGNFGYSVSGAQDVNDDGFNDVVIGTSFNPSFHKGMTYVYFGSAEMDTVPDVLMTAEDTDAYNFGFSVTDAGDINDDGFDDIIIGAVGTSNTEGYTFLFHGGTEMDNIPDLKITGEHSEDDTFGGFGASVSATGDINNDGFEDFIVGNNWYFNHAGKSYVYFGGNPTDTIVDLELEGEFKYNLTAYATSIVEDINNDGFDDILVGTPGYQGDNISDFGTGRVYIYFGGQITDTVADMTLDGEWDVGCFGWSLSSAGDFNNDGHNDFVIGAYNEAYLYFGGPQLNDEPDVIFEGDYWGYILGNAVAAAGDVNGDGFDDVIVGAWGGDDYQGQAFIYFGNDTYENNPDVSLEYSTVINYFGYSVSGIGDYNNDGFDDVAVGDFGMSYSGAARIYFGGEPMDNVADLTIYGESNFSRSLSPAGDFNDDGYDDWIAGDESFDDKGGVYLFLGGDDADDEYDLVFNGEEIGGNFGWSLSGGEDINGDGITDIVVGANGSESFIGKTYIFLGGQELDNTPDEIYEGELAGDNFGYALSCGGDINNDGKSDIVVGANLHKNNGAAYVYISDLSSSVEKSVLQYPVDFQLSQNNPNPFNSSTSISYCLYSQSKVSLKLFDLMGKEIISLKNEIELPGTKVIDWNGKDRFGKSVDPGIYFYVLQVNNISQSKKMVLLR